MLEEFCVQSMCSKKQLEIQGLFINLKLHFKFSFRSRSREDSSEESELEG